MTESEIAGSSGRGGFDAAMATSGVLAALIMAWLGLVYFGVGPETGTRWFDPSGFLFEFIPETTRAALLLLIGPAVFAALAVFGLGRSAVACFLASAGAVATACVAYYGIEAPGVWEFFFWRWTACMALFSLVVGGALSAPFLGRSWRKSGTVARVLSYAPIFVFLVVYERDITGTDPTLSWGLSPWPAVQIFGIELIATLIATVLGGVALGLLGLRRGGILAALGIAAAVGFPAFFLWLGSVASLLPFQPGVVAYSSVGVASLVLLGTLAAWGDRWFEVAPGRASTVGFGAILLGIPLVVGPVLTRIDYSTTRDTRAQLLIDALASHFQTQDEYPDSLDALVESGLIDEVPEPRIGFLGKQKFTYQNFGDSYLLEFSAPRWIQCGYNPPWPEDEAEGAIDADETVTSGAWSCPSKPPVLW